LDEDSWTAAFANTVEKTPNCSYPEFLRVCIALDNSIAESSRRQLEGSWLRAIEEYMIPQVLKEAMLLRGWNFLSSCEKGVFQPYGRYETSASVADRPEAAMRAAAKQPFAYALTEQDNESNAMRCQTRQ
jgi:hypothetical protein